jgi:phosphoribosylglycinamide formyltransferase-1
MVKLGVLGSGKGSNLGSILEAIDSGRLDATVACVVSDVEDAFILERARRHGIPAQFVDASPFKTKLDGAGARRALDVLREHGAEALALAGFMRILKTDLLDAYRGRILNIHPSLLPAFPGLEAWIQALDYGVKVTGCTVHFVDAGMDSGPIILQKAVPVLAGDTPASLHARIQVQEHIAYPQALQWFAEGRLHVAGRHVEVR